MPAQKSKLRKEKRPFAPVDTAITLYKRVLAACLKMPKRYTYLILKDVIDLSGAVMDNAKCANSVFPTNAHEAQIRMDFWIIARAKLQALSSRVDRFLEIPDMLTYHNERSGKSKGITEHELDEIADLIIEEMALLTSTIESDRERFKNLP